MTLQYMIPDNVRIKFRMADLLRENLIRGYQNKKHLCVNGLYVYVFLAETNDACQKGIFSIPSLDFQTIFKIFIKIVTSDC